MVVRVDPHSSCALLRLCLFLGGGGGGRGGCSGGGGCGGRGSVWFRCSRWCGCCGGCSGGGLAWLRCGRCCGCCGVLGFSCPSLLPFSLSLAPPPLYGLRPLSFLCVVFRVPSSPLRFPVHLVRCGTAFLVPLCVLCVACFVNRDP